MELIINEYGMGALFLGAALMLIRIVTMVMSLI